VQRRQAPQTRPFSCSPIDFRSHRDQPSRIETWHRL
jgi:hypothetical protein